MRDEIFKIYLVVYQIKKKYFMWAEERLNIKFFSYMLHVEKYILFCVGCLICHLKKSP